MKVQIKSFALIGLIALAMVSCKKVNVNPVATSPANEVVATTDNNSKVMAPLIIATNVTWTRSFVYPIQGDVVSTTFDNLTSSFYGGNLYIHYALNTSGTFLGGNMLPYSWVSPKGNYRTTHNFALGATIYVMYSTLPGATASTCGSTSPWYPVVVTDIIRK